MDIKSEPSVFSPAKTQRASEVVYSQIYNKIIDGELQHGARLPSERILAEQFQRSRHIIREALRMLQQDGLVRIELGSTGGTFIQALSLKTVEEPLKKLLSCGTISLKELIEYRNINDRGCARLAAVHHTEDDVRILQDILDHARDSIDDPTTFQHYDFAFHRALAAASRNQLASIINDVIVGLNTNTALQALKDYTAEQHRELNRRVYESHNSVFQAILERNPDKAEQCIEPMINLFNKHFNKPDLPA